MRDGSGDGQYLQALQQLILGEQFPDPEVLSSAPPEFAEILEAIGNVTQAAQALAQGDLDARPLPRGKLGQALQEIRDRLQQINNETQRADQLALLNKINLALSASLSLEALLRTLYEQLKQITTVDVYYIALYDPAADLVFFPVFTDGENYESYGFGEMRRRSIHRRPGFTGHILQTGQTLYVPDTLDPNAEMPSTPVRFGGRPARTYLGVPMRLQGKVTGAVSVQSYEPNAYTPEIIHLVEAIAAQIVFVVENARLFEKARLRAEEAETLRQASTAIVESLDTSQAIERILDQLQRVVPYDTASVQLLQGDVMEIVGGRGFEKMEEVIGMRFPVNAASPSGKVVSARKAMYTNDAQADFHHFLIPPHNKIHSWLGIPLVFQDQLIGMLTLDGHKRDQFTTEHLRVVTAFADQVATALKNALLFEDTQRLAITDPLTGIPNRRRFLDVAEAEVERALRHHRPLSLVMIDIDNFKVINDNSGHIAGDEVQKFLAHDLNELLQRKSDIVGRLGGDEFAILLPETDLNGALRLAERVRSKVESAQIPTHQGLMQITISLGVAFFEHGKLHDWEELYSRADQALYTAKHAGRNCVKAFIEGKDYNSP